MDSKKIYDSVENYISAQPEFIQPLLHQMRQIIRQVIPNANEIISYGMPAYKMHGVLVYFAANKNHIGFYPTGSPIIVFKDELAAYKTSKGAIQFPVNESLPTDLIQKIVAYRVNEDEMKATAKKTQKNKS